VTAPSWYAIVGVALAALSLHAVAVRANLLQKILALNVLASGVFMVFIATGAREEGALPDPVPQAMVLTGIVVAVSATALALSLARRVHADGGRAVLPGEDAPYRGAPYRGAPYRGAP
jgi:multicomponent Na+:H+ antiporter subunit C